MSKKDDLKIEYVSVDELKPYEKNARKHTEKDLATIRSSIEEFGMNDPIGIWKDNIIIEGHGRLIACKQLGMKKVPVVRLDHLSDEERRAYTLAHNKTAQMSSWNIKVLQTEIKDIFKVDMGKFGFDLVKEPNSYYGDERERTFNVYNLDKVPDTLSNGFWQMPMIDTEDVIPSDLIGFNYAKTSKKKNCGIHFFIDDYQFERVWNYPEKYIEVLSEYECILTPDFSLYTDMPMPMKIWNTYRSRQIGNYYQSQGIRVIPTVSWAEPDTYQFCFDGLPKHSIIAVSSVGVMRDKDALHIFADGLKEAIRVLKPKTILMYGSKVQGIDIGDDIEVHYYTNKVTEEWNGR